LPERPHYTGVSHQPDRPRVLFNIPILSFLMSLGARSLRGK